MVKNFFEKISNAVHNIALYTITILEMSMILVIFLVFSFLLIQYLKYFLGGGSKEEIWLFIVISVLLIFVTVLIDTYRTGFSSRDMRKFRELNRGICRGFWKVILFVVLLLATAAILPNIPGFSQEFPPVAEAAEWLVDTFNHFCYKLKDFFLA